MFGQSGWLTGLSFSSLISFQTMEIENKKSNDVLAFLNSKQSGCKFEFKDPKAQSLPWARRMYLRMLNKDAFPTKFEHKTAISQFYSSCDLILLWITALNVNLKLTSPTSKTWNINQ